MDLCNDRRSDKFLDSEVVRLPEYTKEPSGLTRFDFNNELSFKDWYKQYSPLLLNRAEMYIDVAEEIGANYFPHPNRAEHLLNSSLLKGRFNRYKLLEMVDKSLIEYYDELDKEYETGILKFDYPVLYDYITNNATTPTEELKVALEMRYDKDVIAFRQSLNSFEEGLNNANRRKRLEAHRQIRELTQSISNDFSVKGNSLKIREIKVGLSSPLGINVGLEKPIKLSLGGSDRVLNLTFLTRLRDFGLGKVIN
ncbi:MAG: hypothetical protein FWB80_02505 [Defluviitaleaceae bacterium]|nr:hypothetical protein [Defluviitaleaceae bacterium]